MAPVTPVPRATVPVPAVPVAVRLFALRDELAQVYVHLGQRVGLRQGRTEGGKGAERGVVVGRVQEAAGHAGEAVRAGVLEEMVVQDHVALLRWWCMM
jgi:hypothetical protein